MVETDSVDQALGQHADIIISSAQRDPGWGTYGQMVTHNPSLMERVHRAGLKDLGYFETFGQAYCFIAELGEKGSLEYIPIKAHHWNWQSYNGGPVAWVSYLNFFNDDTFAQPYTRTHPIFGGNGMFYPDGTPATGFNGSSDDPRHSQALDAGIAKDLWGGIAYEPNYNSIVNAINPTTGQPKGPLNGLLKIGSQYSGLLIFSKDPCCPHWRDYTRASAHLAASHGLDGMWTDNYSPWDSFGQPPLTNAFGDWSVASFRTFLTAHFTPQELLGMGVADANTFDIRQGLRQQIKQWGGNDTNLNDSRWRDARWRDQPLWQAYSIYRRQAGTDALTAYDEDVKQGAALGGKPDFLVAGNDIPVYNLGWTRGNLDMVSTELSPGWNLCAGPRGFMIPPSGRFGPFYKLAREHARSRFVSIWMYMDSYNNYRQNPGMVRTLCYEMLANHALPKFSLGSDPQQHHLGHYPTNAEFFHYVDTITTEFMDRTPIAEVGVFYSSSSILSTVAPGGFINHANQIHQFDFWGWTTALEELHVAYRPLPEWKLTPEVLNTFKVLIVPAADVIEHTPVQEVITPWVAQGGALLVTANSGERQGESGWFKINPQGLSFQTLTGITTVATAEAQKLTNYESGKVLYVRDTVGNTFYQQEAQRLSLLPKFQGYLEQIAPADGSLFMVSGLPPTVSVNIYRNPSRSQLFLDLCNHNLNLTSDAIIPATSLTIRFPRPSWLGRSPLSLKTFTPGENINASLDITHPEHQIRINVPHIDHYLSLLLQQEGEGEVPCWKKYN